VTTSRFTFYASRRSQTRPTPPPKPFCKRGQLYFSNQSDGRRARANTDENGNADSADASQRGSAQIIFSICVHLARATKAVKREDVMRDDLTFHVLRITPVANSANIAAEIFFASTDNFIF